MFDDFETQIQSDELIPDWYDDYLKGVQNDGQKDVQKIS